jgi:SAM-dependent methyltransferase
MLWVCPVCRGGLLEGEESCRCSTCDRVYQIVDGIPDLRLPGSAWIDYEDDRRRAMELVGAVPGDDVETAVRFVFARREGWSPQRIETHVRRVVAAPARLRTELTEWLEPFSSREPRLDLGCGPGMLLAAAAAEGCQGIGVDVSLEWLVVAKRMISAVGGTPVLAAALAEHLPLATAAIGSIAMLDVIEHVADPVPVVRELDRVLAPTGFLAMATPNRFSLSAEPHVGIWGVGWLPRRLQAPYVRRRTGAPYSYVRLLSARELNRLFRLQTSIEVRTEAASVPLGEIAQFPLWRGQLALLYNRLLGLRPAAAILRSLGPLLHVSGRRSASNSRRLPE